MGCQGSKHCSSCCCCLTGSFQRRDRRSLPPHAHCCRNEKWSKALKMDRLHNCQICMNWNWSGAIVQKQAGAADASKSNGGPFMKHLEEVQDCTPVLLDPEIWVSEEYGIYFSFRHGSTSTSMNKDLPAEVINMNNRWRKIEQAEGKQALMVMQDHYTDIRLVLNWLLRFSDSL